jgi:hypothetical protein
MSESTLKASEAEGYIWEGGRVAVAVAVAVDVCAANLFVIFPRKTSPQVPTKDFEVALFVFDEETRHGSGGVE